MFILKVCIKRNPKMSSKEFQEAWLKHGELFLQHAQSYYKAVRYVQYHTLDTSLNENMQKSRGYYPDKYDGIGEIWWNSEEDFRAAISSSEGEKLRQMFVEDERKFTDFKNSIAFFTKAYVLLDLSLSQIPKSCICPITGVLMNNPVIASDGYSYEKSAIAKWLEKYDCSPVTHSHLLNKTLIPNFALKDVIGSIKQKLPAEQKIKVDKQLDEINLQSKIDGCTK